MPKKFKYSYLAWTLVLGGMLSCQPIVSHLGSLNSSQQTQNYYDGTFNIPPVKLNTAYGTINLKISLPIMKNALEYLPKKSGLKALNLPFNKINRIKVLVTGTDNDFTTEKMVYLNITGVDMNLEIPLGKNYVITVKGYDDINEIQGAEVKGYFSITNPNKIETIDVNPKTSPVAKIIEGLKAKDPKIAATLDVTALSKLVEEVRGALHPSLINTTAFVTAINDKKGIVPSTEPSAARVNSGRVLGTITGLKAGDIVIVTCNDPASRPQIVVAPSDVGTSVTYLIDNVTPGEWQVGVVAPGYLPGVPDSTTTDESNEYVKVTVEPYNPTSTASGTSTTDATNQADFNLLPVSWSTTPANVSGNLGSSDQPDAAIDAADKLHMVWRQDGFPDTNSGWIYYTVWNGKVWSRENKKISPPGLENFRGALRPSIAVGNDRLPHVVWSSSNADGKRKILYTHFDGVKWLTPVSISEDSLNPDNSWAADYPEITINKINGHIYVVWQKFDSSTANNYIYFTEYNGSQWVAPIRIATSAGVNPSMPRVASGTDGVIHIIWKNAGAQELRYSNFDGDKWLAEESVPMGTFGNDNNNNIDIKVDDLNRAHIVWKNDTHIQYIMRSGNTWSVSELANQMLGTDMPAKTASSLYIDSVGNVNLIWGTVNTASQDVIRIRKRLNSGWETPMPSPTATLAPFGGSAPTATPTPTNSGKMGYDELPYVANAITADRPIVLFDGKGRFHAIWSNSSSDPNNSDIFHYVKTNADSITEKQNVVSSD